MSERLVLLIHGAEQPLPLEGMTEIVRADLRNSTPPNVWQKVRFVEVSKSPYAIEPFIGTISIAAWFKRRNKRNLCVTVLEATLVALHDMQLNACLYFFVDALQSNSLTSATESTLKDLIDARIPPTAIYKICARRFTVQVEAKLNVAVEIATDQYATHYFQNCDVCAFSESDVIRLARKHVASDNAELVQIHDLTECDSSGACLSRGFVSKEGRVLFSDQ